MFSYIRKPLCRCIFIFRVSRNRVSARSDLSSYLIKLQMMLPLFSMLIPIIVIAISIRFGTDGDSVNHQRALICSV